MKFTPWRSAAKLVDVSAGLSEADRRILRLKWDLSYAIHSAPISDWPVHFASVFAQALDLYHGLAFCQTMRCDHALCDALSRSSDHAWNVLDVFIRRGADTPVELYLEADHHLGLLDGELARASLCMAVSSQDRASVPVSGTANRVAAWSTWILPYVDRARYREEFQGELYDLAGIGATRRAQLWHTLRLLTRAWQLRVEVKKAARSRRAVS